MAEALDLHEAGAEISGGLGFRVYEGYYIGSYN